RVCRASVRVANSLRCRSSRAWRVSTVMMGSRRVGWGRGMLLAPCVPRSCRPQSRTTKDNRAFKAFHHRMQKRSDHPPPLELPAAFEAAAPPLSFTRAGNERFVTQSAISRQIRALEDDLGVALFRRRHRALSLTEQGVALQATCQAVLAQLRTAVAAIR